MIWKYIQLRRVESAIENNAFGIYCNIRWLLRTLNQNHSYSDHDSLGSEILVYCTVAKSILSKRVTTRVLDQK